MNSDQSLVNSRQSSANAADRRLITDHCSLIAVLLRFALAFACLLLPRPGHCQDIEPRRWSHLPIGADFGAVAYAYTYGDISLDPELKIQNAEFDLQCFTR